MNRVFGRYRSGIVELESPVDWVDGARVEVAPEAIEGADSSDAADRAAILQLMDEIEPLDLTLEDEAEIASPQAAVKEKSIAAVERRWQEAS